MSSNSLGKKKTRKGMKKVLFTSFLAVILAVSTSLPGMLLGSGNSDNVAHAESLAHVNLLKNVKVEADLTNVEGKDPYNLHLKLTGSGLADVELLNPSNTVAFYAEELASTGKWKPNGTATVNAKLTLLALEDIPGLANTVSGLTSTLLGSVTDILDTLGVTLDGLARELIGEKGVINIVGKESLLGTVTNLTQGLDELLSKNLIEALNGLTITKKDVKVEVGSHGEIIVNFTDGLGERLEGIVKDVVVELVKQIEDTLRGLKLRIDVADLGDRLIDESLEGPLSTLLRDLLNTVGGTLDPILDSTVNELLDQLVTEVVAGLVGEVRELVDNLTTEVLKLLNGLLSLQVLGDTTVELDLTVDKPAIGKDADVKVYGGSVNRSAITIDVLSSFQDYDIITFKEGTPPAEEPKPEPKPQPKPEPKPQPKPEKPEKPGIKLPDTATAAGVIGLTGLTALLAGIATRLFGRRK